MGDWPELRPAHGRSKPQAGGGCVSAGSQTDVLIAGVAASGRVWGAVPADSWGDPDPSVTPLPHRQCLTPVLISLQRGPSHLSARLQGRGVHGQLHPLSFWTAPTSRNVYLFKLESVSLELAHESGTPGGVGLGEPTARTSPMLQEGPRVRVLCTEVRRWSRHSSYLPARPCFTT